ncbi:hypothetical protein EV130_10199 [Rhizobium azibense]|uniref:Uncharacterized protein n=1 Tax=Rhizobium azibense TaxID=1136135 RepID=A0A4R3R5W7_9HYPH|nr:hypothetical protein EV130_10199 [Rhizobium azibense]
MFAGAVERNDVGRIDLPQGDDGLAQIVRLIWGQMEAADHRMEDENPRGGILRLTATAKTPPNGLYGS